MKKKNSQPIEISVVVPVYNEGLIIDEMYSRLHQAVTTISTNYEFIFVNDGSKDGTLVKLLALARKDDRVYYINFSRNFGHQIAVTAGLDVCRGEAVVIIDGDLQDPPELIPELYAKYREGNEIVYARRRERKGESIFKKASAKLFYRLLRHLTSVEIPLDTGDFRLVDQKVVHYLRLMPEQNKFLRGQIAWLGFRQAEVLFDRDQRQHGKSGYSFGKMVRLAIDGITGFSDKPLQYLTRLGITISLLAIGIILYALYAHLILDRTIAGWTSLIVSSMFIGGVQLISIGVIGEYISRINKNVQNRPLYIMDQTNCKTDASVSPTPGWRNP